MWEKLLANRVFTHIGVLVLATCVFLVYLWLIRPSPPAYTPTPGPLYKAPVPPKIAKKVGKIIEERKEPSRFEFYSKPQLAATLKIPEIEFLQDNVISVAEVAPHRGKTTAIATIGLDSDNVYRGSILLRQEPIPFWGWEREWHGGVWYGLAGKNKLQGELEFLPMRIGPVYPSVKGVVGMEDGGNFNGQLLLGVKF